VPERIKPAKSSSKRGEEVFTLFRDYVKHEDMLINQRMTWMITIQSFLIAMFGFSYQKKLEIISKVFTEKSLLEDKLVGFMQTVQTYNVFLIIICMIGIGMSWITGYLLEAANLSIGGLEKKWETTSELYEIKHLPKLTGGYDADIKAKETGKKLSILLTRFFIGFWAFLVIFIIIDVILNLQIK
jgi:hypothetical protein